VAGSTRHRNNRNTRLISPLQRASNRRRRRAFIGGLGRSTSRRDRNPPAVAGRGGIVTHRACGRMVCDHGGTDPARVCGESDRCHVATRAHADRPARARAGEPTLGLSVKAPSLRSRFAALTRPRCGWGASTSASRCPCTHRRSATRRHSACPETPPRCSSARSRAGCGQWITIPPTSRRPFETTVGHDPAAIGSAAKAERSPASKAR
jgi:hypothetical protein